MTYTALIALFASVSSSLGLPPTLLPAVCKVESGNNIYAVNQDDGGSPSLGVCQMKESTARFLGYRGSAKGLLDPRVNVLYAGKYLKYQLDRYDGDLHKAVSAYNMGSYSVDRRGRTRNRRYVASVLEAME